MGRRPTRPGPVSWGNSPNFVHGQSRWRRFYIGAATAATNGQSVVDSWAEDDTGSLVTASVGTAENWQSGNYNGDYWYIKLTDATGQPMASGHAANLRVFIQTITDPAANCGSQVTMGYMHDNDGSSRPIGDVDVANCGISMRWDSSVSPKKKFRLGGTASVITSGAFEASHATATIMWGGDADESNAKKQLAIMGSGFNIHAPTIDPMLGGGVMNSVWEQVKKDTTGTDVANDPNVYVWVGIGSTKALSSVTGKFKFWYTTDRMFKGWQP